MPKGITIKLYRATTAGNLPPAGSLEDGELALDALSDPPHLWTQVPAARDPTGRIDLLADGGMEAGPTPPTNPSDWDLWFNTDTTNVMYFDGNAGVWRVINGPTNYGLAPTNPKIGELWWNGAILYLWNGTTWIPVTQTGGPWAPLINPAAGQNNYLPINNPTFTGILTGPRAHFPLPATTYQPLVSFGTVNQPTANLTAQANAFYIRAGYWNNASTQTATATSAVQILLSTSAVVAPNISFYVQSGLTVGATAFSVTQIASFDEYGLRLFPTVGGTPHRAQITMAAGATPRRNQFAVRSWGGNVPMVAGSELATGMDPTGANWTSVANTWTATGITGESIQARTGAFTFTTDTGLTVDATFTPTVRMTIDNTGVNIPTGATYKVNGVPIGAGGVTSITAGNGLTGGTITTTGTIALSAPVSIANGGTGAITAPLARTSLGAAPLASPTFTGTPAGPTAAVGTSTTQLASTAFVQAAVQAATTGWLPVNNPTYTGLLTGPNLTLTGPYVTNGALTEARITTSRDLVISALGIDSLARFTDPDTGNFGGQLWLQNDTRSQLRFGPRGTLTSVAAIGGADLCYGAFYHSAGTWYRVSGSANTTQYSRIGLNEDTITFYRANAVANIGVAVSWTTMATFDATGLTLPGGLTAATGGFSSSMTVGGCCILSSGSANFQWADMTVLSLNAAGWITTASALAAPAWYPQWPWGWVYNTGNGDMVWNWADGAPMWWCRSDLWCFNNRGPTGGVGLVDLCDERGKENIAADERGLEVVSQLHPVTFDRNCKASQLHPHREMGFSAQNVRAALPEATVNAGMALEDGTGGLDSENPTIAVAPMSLIAVLVNAVKELNRRLEVLESN